MRVFVLLETKEISVCPHCVFRETETAVVEVAVLYP